MLNEAFKFHARACEPAKFPIVCVLTYMLQSGEYMPAPEFAMVNRKMDILDTQRLWDIIQFPERTTIEDAKLLLFDQRSYGPKVSL